MPLGDTKPNLTTHPRVSWGVGLVNFAQNFTYGRGAPP